MRGAGALAIFEVSAVCVVRIDLWLFRGILLERGPVSFVTGCRGNKSCSGWPVPWLSPRGGEEGSRTGPDRPWGGDLFQTWYQQCGDELKGNGLGIAAGSEKQAELRSEQVQSSASETAARG